MKNQLVTTKKYAEDSGFTVQQLRWWIFNREKNNMAKNGVCLKIAGRVYIDPTKFDDWFESQNEWGTAT